MTERSCKKGYYVVEKLFKLEDSVNVLGNLFRICLEKFCSVNHLLTKELPP